MLLPDGTDWRAVLLIGLPAGADGQVAGLEEWAGLAQALHIEVAGQPPVVPAVDGDLDAPSRARPSTVHFLRFALAPAFRQAVRAGASVQLVVDHRALQARIALSADALHCLAADWD